MAERISAGLLMYRLRDGCIEFFLAHPGGPFFERKNNGHWTVPKGEVQAGEELLQAARREFEEETGLRPDGERFIPLGWIRQRGGKIVYAWGFLGDWPEGRELRSGTFRMEWPPGSGQFGDFPEIDKTAFYRIESAERKIKASQQPFLRRLSDELERAT